MELERSGFPIALISALPELAASVGAPRVVRGVRIEHVCGDPTLPPDHDRELRYRIVSRALDALHTRVDRPTVFEPLGGEVGR
jgi:glycine/betaine/sarcosine/D-proline reductase family selenoprotein B